MCLVSSSSLIKRDDVEALRITSIRIEESTRANRYLGWGDKSIVKTWMVWSSGSEV